MFAPTGRTLCPMSTRRRPPVSLTALRLAGEADADPRTAARYLAGERPRGRVADRLADAARRLGLDTPPSAA